MAADAEVKPLLWNGRNLEMGPISSVKLWKNVFLLVSVLSIDFIQPYSHNLFSSVDSLVAF